MTYTLYNCDCLDYMRTMDAGSVDAIITDLPYGTTACKWDNIIPFVPMWECVKRVLKPRGVFVTTASQPFTSKLVCSNLEWFRYEWIWEKSIGSCFLDANRKPIKAHEDICIFSSGRTTYNPQMQHGKSYKKFVSRTTQAGKAYNKHDDNYWSVSDGQRYPRSVIFFQNGNNKSFHPTQKPVALYEYLILTYTNPDAVVLDFCCGSGTTGVACMMTGRNFIGCELDAGYYSIAEKRIHDASQQMLLPIDI